MQLRKLLRVLGDNHNQLLGWRRQHLTLEREPVIERGVRLLQPLVLLFGDPFQSWWGEDDVVVAGHGPRVVADYGSNPSQLIFGARQRLADLLARSQQRL